MSYVNPSIDHPGLVRNAIGMTIQDYKGVASTLCAGCGHDSVTAAIQKAFWEMAIEPHRAAKMSGIGCSSKTTAYFLRQSHGFNSVHGRMPSVTLGANAANRQLKYLGVSGDGDSLSIGLGQMCHAIRRNVDMVYVIENNGVYGLTKGQFSAAADNGTLSKIGEANSLDPLDPAMLAVSIGATFVARSFSGDKEQLVPLIKAGLSHSGFALIDVISPCVTFNNHKGSTRSYAHTREHQEEVAHADFVPKEKPIEIRQRSGSSQDVPLHDGSTIRLSSLPLGYDPSDRAKVFAYLQQRTRVGEIPTGMLYLDPGSKDMHGLNQTVQEPLGTLPFDTLCPGDEALQKLQQRFR